MTLRVNHQEFMLLRDFIKEQCGIMLGDDKAYLIENRLSRPAQDAGCKSFGAYYLELKHSSRSGSLRRKLVDAISTNETSWFRDQHPFVILQECLLPQLHEEKIAGKRSGVNIWSAACSTGQEPYSIAMTILDFSSANGPATAHLDQTKIFASDISGITLAFARAGKYDSIAIKRGLGAIHLNGYFKKEDNQWLVGDKLKTMVTFAELNLKEPFYGLIGPFDIIFLRNILIYFDDDFKKILFDRFARLLSPGGYLFLGTGETVRNYTDKFEILEHKGAIYYRVTP